MTASIHLLRDGFALLGSALAAAEEAVALRRQLAAARPDAFIPNMAMSLSVLADMLEANQRIGEAVAQDHAAVSALAPYCRAAPLTFGRPMLVYARDYQRRAEAAGVEIDADLLTPIFEGLVTAGLLKGEE